MTDYFTTAPYPGAQPAHQDDADTVRALRDETPAKIRFEQLQLGELAYLEQGTGTTFQAFGDVMADPTRSMIPMLRTLGVILLRRRGNPQAGPEDADLLSPDDIMGAFDMDDATDPE